MNIVCRPLLSTSLANFSTHAHIKQLFTVSRTCERGFVSQIMMSEAKEFPPKKLRAIVSEVAALLKEKKESVSVAETVCCISILSVYY